MGQVTAPCLAPTAADHWELPERICETLQVAAEPTDEADGPKRVLAASIRTGSFLSRQDLEDEPLIPENGLEQIHPPCSGGTRDRGRPGRLDVRGGGWSFLNAPTVNLGRSVCISAALAVRRLGENSTGQLDPTTQGKVYASFKRVVLFLLPRRMR